MLNKKMIGGIAAVVVAFAVQPALAADAPKKPKPMNTLSLEMAPEIYGATSSSHNAGDFADMAYKAALSHTFENNIVFGGAFQYTQRWPDLKSAASSVDQAELSLGYKWKLTDAFTVTPAVLLGYAFGDQPKIDPNNKFNPDGYYAASLSGDLKLDSHWTWNVFNVRYRNAFDYTWITPKIATGITYKVDDNNAVYLSVGNAWKDKGDGNGLLEDKYNIAVGYKYSF